MVHWSIYDRQCHRMDTIQYMSMPHFIHVSVKKYEVLGLAVLARHRAGEEPGATQHMPQRSHAPCQSPTPHHGLWTTMFYLVPHNRYLVSHMTSAAFSI